MYTFEEDRIRIIEMEILETAMGIEIQDLKWKEIIKDIISKYNLKHYPMKSHFKSSGNMSVYTDICKMAEHSYMAEIIGIEMYDEYLMAECIFKTMLRQNIKYMPSEKDFKKAKQLIGLKYILSKSTLENERIRLGLLTKDEHEKLMKK